jgi:hypothetical protein
MTDDDPKTPAEPRWPPFLMAGVFGLVGVWFILTGLGAVEWGEMQAAPWVMTAAGAAFLGFSGLLFASFLQPEPGKVMGPGDPPLLRLVQAGGALLATASLAAAFSWVAWGEGARNFVETTTFGASGVSVTTAQPGDEAEGRFMFGLLAVLGWGMAAVAGWGTLRALFGAAKSIAGGSGR